MAIMDSNSESNQYQYIQDTSLASLDSKTSPLAMLVRTCSQIGADPPMAAAAKSKKPAAAAPVSATAAAADRPHSASPASSASAYLGHAAAKHHRNHNNNYMEEPPKPAKLNFKPYENTVLTPSPHHAVQQHHHSSPYGLHLHSGHNNNNNNNNNNDDECRPKSSSSEENGSGHGKKRKSASPRDEYGSHHKSSRRSSSSASSSETAAAASTASAAASDPSTNPIIRSGLEVMHGTAAKAFCPPPPMPAHSPYKPDPLAAFRHTYLPGAPWMPAAVSLAAASAGKPSPSDCKDPMCGGPASGCGQQQQHAAAAAALAFATQYHPMMAAAGACPAGCVQCDHQRYLSSLMAAASVPAFYAPVARPYTCSWVIPGGGHMQSSSPTSAEAAAAPSLCGKSFSTSDELLQHIRTHTSSGAGGTAVSAAACMAAGAAGPMSPTTAAAFSAYNSHLSRHLFHHPSAAAYGKPPPSMMPPSPFSAFNPTAAYCYPPPPSSAAAAAAAYHHHHHQQLYSPRGDTSTATVSR